MPYPLPLTRTEAYLAYKAGVIQQSDLKPSLAVPRNGIDAWLAYWAGLAEDYPKREDGTPHILQEEEAYIAYLCGVINEYPEKCLRRVGAYLRYIISARWGRPDHPLNREELYLSLIKTQFIPSGDPSSDIVIDGTTKAPFVDVKMYGDTTQQTYTGKNLWNMAADNRLDWSQYLTEDEEGWITGTGNNGFYNFWTKPNLELEPDTTYYYVLEVAEVYAANNDDRLQITSETSSTSNNCQFTESVNIPWRSLQAGGVYTGAITTKSSFSGNGMMLRSFLRPYNTASRIKFRLSIVKAQPDTANFIYEPYVGGAPSPSPEYPQPIKTVTGSQTVKITGKNLYDKDSGNLLVAYIDSSHPTITYNEQNRIVWIPCEPNTAYNIDRQVTSGGVKQVAWAEQTPAVGVETYGRVDWPTDKTNINFTTGATARYIVVRLWQVNQDTSYTVEQLMAKLQITKASAPTAYESYTATDYPLDLGDIKLCGLGDDGNGNPLYEDYIYQDFDEWKLHKATGQIVFDSSTPWYKHPTTGGNVFVLDNTGFIGYRYNTGQVATALMDTDLVSALGANGGVSDNAYGRFGITLDSQLMVFRGEYDSSYTPQIFNEQMVGNYVYGALVTPTDTVITDQNLIDQLNALKQGGAEEGTTYIKVSATDPNLPAKLYVEAAKYV